MLEYIYIHKYYAKNTQIFVFLLTIYLNIICFLFFADTHTFENEFHKVAINKEKMDETSGAIH